MWRTLICKVVYCINNQIKRWKDTPDNSCKPSAYHETGTRLPQTINIQPSPEYKGHKTKEAEFWERQVAVSCTLNIVTAIAAVFAAAAAGGVIWSVIVARDATIDANRAWIMPIFAHIGLPLQLKQPIQFSIDYQNVGRAPATHIHSRFDAGYFDVPPNEDGSKIKVRQNVTCDGLMPDETGGTEFPIPSNLPANERGPHNLDGNSMNSNIAHKLVVDQAMLNGRHRFYVQGCIAYSTMEIPGRSKFCFYFRQDGNNYDLLECPGNSAD
jgi:hypothetical protein